MTSEELDIFEKVVVFNKRKFEIIQKISELEILNRRNTDEFKKLIEGYKLINECYRNLLSRMTHYDTINWSDTLLSLNRLEDKIQELQALNNFFKIKDNYIPIIRSIQDFGFFPFQFVGDDNPVKLPDIGFPLGNTIIAFIGSIIDEKKSEEIDFDKDKANNIINFDFYHTIFWLLEREINSNSFPDKKWLIHFKNNLVLLNSSLEATVISSRWDDLNRSILLDEFTIKTLGLPLDEYRKILNNIFLDEEKTLEDIVIKDCISKKQVDKEMSDKNNIINSMIFKTLYYLSDNTEDKKYLIEMVQGQLDRLSFYYGNYSEQVLKRLKNYYQEKIKIMNDDSNLQKYKSKNREFTLY